MKRFFTSIMLLAGSLAAMATDYPGTLAVVIDGKVAQPTKTQIVLDKQDDGKYGLTLKNFILVREVDEMTVGEMAVGNIVLKDIEAKDEQGVMVLETNQEILIEAGDTEGVDMWIGPLLGEVPVELKAVVNEGVLTVDIVVPIVGQDVKVLFDSREFQLPNSGFEEFHKATASGETSDEPNNWHSFMSCTGSFASMVNSVKHTFISEDVRPGSEGNKSVLLKSGTVSVLGIIEVTANGTLTTGRLKAGGMSATSKDNNAFIDLANEEKDANGDPFYTLLNTLPDSISVWVKFKQGEAVPEHPYATMSAVITDGSYYQEPKPEGETYSDIIVGEARNNQIESTGEWQKITVPFEYSDNNKSPKGILVTFSTNADPGEGTDNDELYIDDVELVYNSSLSDLTVNGETLSGFASDKYDYEYNLGENTTIDEIIDNISYEVTGNEAHGVVSVSGNNTMNITVLSADLLSSHTYTIKFSEGASGVENIVNAENTGKTIYNLNGQKVNSMKKGEVYITKYANGKIVKSINK